MQTLQTLGGGEKVQNMLFFALMSWKLYVNKNDNITSTEAWRKKENGIWAGWVLQQKKKK